MGKIIGNGKDLKRGTENKERINRGEDYKVQAVCNTTEVRVTNMPNITGNLGVETRKEDHCPSLLLPFNQLSSLLQRHAFIPSRFPVNTSSKDQRLSHSQRQTANLEQLHKETQVIHQMQSC